jgi:hypothetical protein
MEQSELVEVLEELVVAIMEVHTPVAQVVTLVVLEV